MVAVFGLGCAGNRMLSYMRGRIKAAFVAINTERYVLDGCQADAKLLIRRPGRQPHVITEYMLPGWRMDLPKAIAIAAVLAVQ